MSEENKERKGYTWIECGSSGGYWRKITGIAHTHKRPLFCPHCERISGLVDDEYFESLGICYACFVQHVENRDKPTVDIEYYRSLALNSNKT